MTTTSNNKLTDINKIFWRSFSVNASFNYERQDVSIHFHQYFENFILKRSWQILKRHYF